MTMTGLHSRPRWSSLALALGVVSLLAAAPGFAASPLDEALKLVKRGETIEALALLKPIASEGNAEAQYQLGQIYERGLGIVPDDYWAHHWYREAANQGHPAAQQSLDALITRTSGNAATETTNDSAQKETTSDGKPELLPEAAVDTQAEPAAAPETDATVAPPVAATNTTSKPAEPAMGLLVPVGPAELAAMNFAQSKGLSIRFDPNQPVPRPRGDDVTGLPTGDGVPLPADAATTVTPASSGTVAAVAAQPGATPESGPGPDSAAAGPALATLPAGAGPRDLTGISMAELAAMAESGAADAARELGLRHHQGRGAPKDLALALKWYQKAAEQGDAIAQFNLGNLYLMGEGVTRDDAWAVTWFRRAATQGHAAAQHNLDNLLRLEAGAN